MEMRVMTDREWYRRNELGKGDNQQLHWKGVSSWVDEADPFETPEKKPAAHQFHMGGTSAIRMGHHPNNRKYPNIGFVPVIEGVPEQIRDSVSPYGGITVIGTLYMGDKPVRVPQNPTKDGDIENYVPNTKLEMREAMDDPAYMVMGIRDGNRFYADRPLLKNVSYLDLVIALSLDTYFGRPVITISSLIKTLTAYKKKYGELPVTFFSNEWTADLEEMEYQERTYSGIRKRGNALRIMLDH